MSKANYDLPDKVLHRVMKLSGAKTKKEALIIAMEEYLKNKKQELLLKSYGKYDLEWTQKSLRKHRG